MNYVGHATLVVEIGRIRVLTDPILRDRVFFLQRHGKNPAPDLLEERPPDIVLLSHLHYDHADLPSLRRLPPSTVVIAPRGSGRYLEQWAGIQVHEVAEGERVRAADVEISAFPAEHNSFSGPRPITACLSYVLRNRLSVFFAGDTDLHPAMHEIGEEYDLDLALLPVWGYSHRLGNGHLSPLTAAEALTRLRPRVAVPIHWGALRLLGPHVFWKSRDFLNSPPYSFAEYASRLAPETEVRILQPGEWTRIERFTSS